MAHFSCFKLAKTARVALAALSLALVAVAGTPLASPAFGDHHGETKSPKSWNLAKLKTMKLEPLPDIDWAPVESGTKKNTETVFYEGDNVVVVWEAGPAKLLIPEPTTYDEFVVVLKGTLVLTDAAGKSATYTEGDMFTVPKGFSGTWDMTEEFRELIVIDAKLYNAEF
jgi:uncharacterized cupin superfamily protein